MNDPKPQVVVQTQMVSQPISENLRQSCERYFPIDEELPNVEAIVESRAAWKEAAKQCGADHAGLINATADESEVEP